MSRSQGSVLLAGLLVASWLGAEGSAAAPKSPAVVPDDIVSKSLAREIIGPRQTLVETIRECESGDPAGAAVESVEAWEKQAERMRSDALRHVIFRGQAAAWRPAKGKVEWLGTLEGAWLSDQEAAVRGPAGPLDPRLALRDQKSRRGKVPVVLNVNGHDARGKGGRLQAGPLHQPGQAGDARLNVEWFGMGQFRDGEFPPHDLINHIDLCGTGGSPRITWP